MQVMAAALRCRVSENRDEDTGVSEMDETRDKAGGEGSPWGGWATIGISVIVMALFVLVQLAVLLGFIAYQQMRFPHGNLQQFMDQTTGITLIISSILSSPICSGVIIIFVLLRRNYPPVRYLGLKMPTGAQAGTWIIGSLLFVVASDAVTHLLNRPVVPDFMVKMYSTAYMIPLLYVALLIAAPIFEEIFFRGFIYQGLVHTGLRLPGAVVLTALCWSVIHMQYDIYGIIHIFSFGILLGIARWKTGSVYVTILMHALVNLIATIEVYVYIRYFVNG